MIYFLQNSLVFVLGIPPRMFCCMLAIVKVIDDGKFVGAVFLNLAKAFNCVDHEILLQKLTCYDI